MFQKPFPEDDLHPATIKCLGWIKSCGRPTDQLNIKRIHEDFVKKKNITESAQRLIVCISYNLAHLENLCQSMGSLNVNLTHWGLVTPCGVMNFDNIGLCNGMSPNGYQAITWTNVDLLSMSRN